VDKADRVHLGSEWDYRIKTQPSRLGGWQADSATAIRTIPDPVSPSLSMHRGYLPINGTDAELQRVTDLMAPPGIAITHRLIAEGDKEALLPEEMLIFAGSGWQRSKPTFWRRRGAVFFLSASRLRNRAKGEARRITWAPAEWVCEPSL